MIEFLSNVPFFVWPLLILLVAMGLKARKAYPTSLSRLFLTPLIFFSWSLISFVTKSYNAPSFFLWLLCLVLGLVIGYLHMKKTTVQFDKTTKQIQMPGSLMPLLLSLSIFSSKFSGGLIESIFPHLKGVLLSLELVSAFILGVLMGRGINFFLRYRAHPS